MFRSLLITYALLLNCLQLSAAQTAQDNSPTEHSRVTLISKTTGIPIDSGMTTIGIRIQLDKDWHTYWLNPGDSGAPIRVKWSTFPQNALNFSELEYPIPERIILSSDKNAEPGNSEAFTINNFGYSNEVILTTNISVNNDNLKNIASGFEFKIETEIEWLVCKEICIPYVKNLSITIPALKTVEPSKDFEMIESFQHQQAPQQALGTATVTPKDGKFLLRLNDQRLKNFSFIDLIPSSPKYYSNQPPEHISELADEWRWKIKGQVADQNPGKLLLILKDNVSLQTKSFWINPIWRPNQAENNFWLMILFAFIGGALLNIMPCVLPVLGLKLFSKTETDRRKKIWQSFSYLLGVMFTFNIFAFVLGRFTAASHTLGWGFQLQNPYFVYTLIILFILLTLNFLNVLKLEWPQFTAFNKWHPSKFEDFFFGSLVVFIASPCTAPFMSAAIGYSLTQDQNSNLLIFNSLGLGFSLPFVLFRFSPTSLFITKKLLKYEKTVKWLLALPLGLTALWLGWVLYQQITHSSFGLGFFTILTLIFLILIKYPIKKWQHFLEKHRLPYIILATIVCLAFSFSFFEPQNRQRGDQKHSGLSWATYTPNMINSIRKGGQNVFVNVTAAWCITCQFNENVTFSNKKVLEALKSKKISLVKADWTNKDPEISYFLNQHNRAGVPFYVLYNADKNKPYIILPEILTPSIFLNAINKLENQ